LLFSIALHGANEHIWTTHHLQRLDNRTHADTRNAACYDFFNFDEFGAAGDEARTLALQDSFACCDFLIRVGFKPNPIDRTCV
jgi:hypothetical protein